MISLIAGDATIFKKISPLRERRETAGDFVSLTRSMASANLNAYFWRVGDRNNSQCPFFALAISAFQTPTPYFNSVV